MRIKGCKTIAEYREVQRQHINRWVDDNFISLKALYHGNLLTLCISKLQTRQGTA